MKLGFKLDTDGSVLGTVEWHARVAQSSDEEGENGNAFGKAEFVSSDAPAGVVFPDDAEKIRANLIGPAEHRLRYVFATDGGYKTEPCPLVAEWREKRRVAIKELMG